MANEKRLIDAKPLTGNGWHLVQTGESNRFLRSMSLADVPTVDAVEVVRCKECRHCSRDENIVGAYGYCYHFGCYAHEPMVEADDFCSYGERAVQDGK